MGKACVFLLMVMVMLGCSSDDPAPTTQAHAPVARSVSQNKNIPALPDIVQNPKHTVVSWVSHSEGKFEPCGCVSGMFGGLVRRMTLVKRFDSPGLIQVEGGGWLAGYADYQILKTEFYLKALKKSGIHAVGIGLRELKLPSKDLSNLIKVGASNKLPIVSCNLFDKSGKLMADAYARVHVNNEDFFITAVVPSIQTDQYKISDPFDSLFKVVAEANKARIIVLADFTEDELRTLAQRVPTIDVLIGGNVSHSSNTAESVGSCRIIYTANHGKTLGWWQFGGSECAFELIKDSIPDDEPMRTMVKQYQEALSITSFSIDTSHSGRTKLGQVQARYVGDQACIACHKNDHHVFIKSRHAHSFDSLVSKSYHHDPDCLRCHVTGLGQKSGFVRKEAPKHVKQVSCESCHGPASAHVSNRSKGILDKDGLQVVTQGTCLKCHDKENSPEFSYETYWPKIAH